MAITLDIRYDLEAELKSDSKRLLEVSPETQLECTVELPKVSKKPSKSVFIVTPPHLLPQTAYLEKTDRRSFLSIATYLSGKDICNLRSTNFKLFKNLDEPYLLEAFRFSSVEDLYACYTKIDFARDLENYAEVGIHIPSFKQFYHERVEFRKSLIHQSFKIENFLTENHYENTLLEVYNNQIIICADVLRESGNGRIHCGRQLELRYNPSKEIEIPYCYYSTLQLDATVLKVFNNKLIVGYQDGSLKFFRMDPEFLTELLHTHRDEEPVTALTCGKEGDQPIVVSGLANGLVKVYNLANGRLKRNFVTLDRSVDLMEMCQAYLATANKTRNVISIWKIDGTLLRRLSSKNSFITCLHWPTLSRLYSGNNLGQIRVRDPLATEREKQRITIIQTDNAEVNCIQTIQNQIISSANGWLSIINEDNIIKKRSIYLGIDESYSTQIKLLGTKICYATSRRAMILDSSKKVSKRRKMYQIYCARHENITLPALLCTMLIIGIIVASIFIPKVNWE